MTRVVTDDLAPPGPPSAGFFVAADEQVWCDTGGELLLLHVPSGIYYGVESTGERVWRLVQEPRTAAELRDALLAEYEVAPSRCEAELSRLLEQLMAAGLLRVAGSRADSPPTPTAGPGRSAYTEPRLLRFGDRQACLLWWVGLEGVFSGRLGAVPPSPAAGAPLPLPARAETLVGDGRWGDAREHTLELLVSCARVRMTEADIERLRTLASNVADWERVADAADRHGMLPLLYWHLHRHAADLLPPANLGSLRREFMRNAIITLEITGELQQICALFAEHRILAVPYKGPALAASAYGNLALRRRGDLDLLLNRNDILRARELLLERGYAARHELSAGAAEHLLRMKYHEILDRSSSPAATVELHWAFTSRDLHVHLNLAVLAPRLDTVRVGGTVLPAFSLEDQLLILCTHGSKHRWTRVEWICAVAELLRGSDPLDGAALLERATAAGSRRMLLLGVYLSHVLLGAALPGVLWESAQNDRAVVRLAGRVRELQLREAEVSAHPRERAGGALWFRITLQDRLAGKARVVAYHVTTPGVGEWRVLSLGGSLVPLHALSRPVKMLVEAGRRAYRTLRRSDSGSTGRQ